MFYTRTLRVYIFSPSLIHYKIFEYFLVLNATDNKGSDEVSPERLIGATQFHHFVRINVPITSYYPGEDLFRPYPPKRMRQGGNVMHIILAIKISIFMYHNCFLGVPAPQLFPLQTIAFTYFWYTSNRIKLHPSYAKKSGFGSFEIIHTTSNNILNNYFKLF